MFCGFSFRHQIICFLDNDFFSVHHWFLRYIYIVYRLRTFILFLRFMKGTCIVQIRFGVDTVLSSSLHFDWPSCLWLQFRREMVPFFVCFCKQLLRTGIILKCFPWKISHAFGWKGCDDAVPYRFDVHIWLRMFPHLENRASVFVALCFGSVAQHLISHVHGVFLNKRRRIHYNLTNWIIRNAVLLNCCSEPTKTSWMPMFVPFE